MYSRSKELFLYLPIILLNLVFIVGFVLIYVYTLDAQNNIYQNFLNDAKFHTSVLYGLYISFISIFISVSIFLFIYYLLFLLKFTYKKELTTWLFFLQIPLILPYSFVAFLMFLMFFPTGVLKDFMPLLVGTSPAIIIAYVYKVVPFLLFISFPTLLKVTKDEIKLHSIYSNKPSHFFYKILLRRNLKIVSIGLYIVFAYIFNAYEIPSILGSNIEQMPAVLVYERLGEFGLNSMQISYAGSLVYFFITLCFIPLSFFIYTLLKKYAF